MVLGVPRPAAPFPGGGPPFPYGPGLRSGSLEGGLRWETLSSGLWERELLGEGEGVKPEFSRETSLAR